jgi:hypothetical protein
VGGGWALQVLWRSLPPALRNEQLLAWFAKSLADYRAAGCFGQWQHSYTVLGQPVCRSAFRIVTGIGGSSLDKARDGALAGHQSCLTSAELGKLQLVVNTSKPKLYLDARQWLEHYAATHAEESPMKPECFLPAGRKFLYWVAYEADRTAQGKPAASLQTFLEAWRVETPWIIIMKSLSKFTACGLCEYLKVPKPKACPLPCGGLQISGAQGA